jgi:hypothetical protein
MVRKPDIMRGGFRQALFQIQFLNNCSVSLNKEQRIQILRSSTFRASVSFSIRMPLLMLPRNK